MKLFNILFLAVRRSEFDFLEYRHTIDSRVYESMSKSFEVTHLKLTEPGFTPPNKTNELFVKGRTGFFYLPLKLCKYVCKENPTVILVHGFMFPVQLLILQLFIPKTTKLIIQHHAEKPFINKVKRLFQKIAYSRADAYLFSSKELADVFLEDAIIKDKHKIFEVMEGSTLFRKKDKAEARKRLNTPNTLMFLWVGRLDNNKDPLTVIKALHKFKESGNEFKLYMIYATDELEKEIKNYIDTNNLQTYINLLGKVPHPELEDWYSAADYFIAGSHYEGSGIALCEAMACGCIPLATAISSFLKMTDNGQLGFLFEPGNTNDLLHKLSQLHTINPEELSTKVALHFNKELSLQAIGKKIEAIANSLLQK